MAPDSMHGIAVAQYPAMFSQGIDLYDLVAQSLPTHAIILLNSDFVVETWNHGAEQVTGISAEEATGHQITTLHLPDGAAARGTALRIAKDRGRFEQEGWWAKADGSRCWVDEVIAPVLDDGQLVGYVDIARLRNDAPLPDDGEANVRAHLLSADRRAAFLDEASSILAASATNFESALRSLARLPIGRLADWCVIYVRQPDGKLTVAEVAHRDSRQQSRMEQMLADTIKPVPPHPLLSVVENAEPELYEEMSDELVESLARDSAEARLLSELGLGSAIMTPLLARGRVLGAILLVSGRSDRYTTEDLHLAEALGRRAAIAIDNARLYREAQEANRAKADFLAIVSHELRTPLNAIMGYSDIIDTGISGPVTENQRRQIARIRTSARHLLQIIEEILSYARLESGGLEVDYEKTTVGTIADEAAAITEPVAVGKGLVMKLELPGNDHAFVTDPSKARQILVNILSNAIKFTERGTIHLQASVEGDTAVFTIRDTGVGMSKDQLEKIFDPFWQIERPTTRRAGGTGLGLSVASRFADLLGGTIRVESTLKVGSTFQLRFPLQPAQIQ